MVKDSKIRVFKKSSIYLTKEEMISIEGGNIQKNMFRNQYLQTNKFEDANEDVKENVDFSGRP